MTDIILGIDGGGTQTRVVVSPADNLTPAGEGKGGPCNIAAVEVAEAMASVRAATETALTEGNASYDDVRAVCAGVAGFSYIARRDEFRKCLRALFPKATVIVEPDYRIAFIGATEAQPGILVISGTGSVAYGENSAHRSHKAGSYGYLIDDGGSGYAAGRLALAAVLRAADGTAEPTKLTELIHNALGTATSEDIIAGVYGSSISRIQIAALSRVVGQAAAEGDRAANSILLQTATALAQLVRGVTSALFEDTSEDFPIAPVGGLWQSGDILRCEFERAVRSCSTHAVVRDPLRPPVWGALHRAQESLR